jgi:hypothetical protein
MMDDWLMTAFDYYTDCKVTILEVEVEWKGCSFWRKTYQSLKHDCGMFEWMNFFKANQPRLSLMTSTKWRREFKETMNEGYCRSRCLFIDQVYHAGHKWLHEALYANFSMLQ